MSNWQRIFVFVTGILLVITNFNTVLGFEDPIITIHAITPAKGSNYFEVASTACSKVEASFAMYYYSDIMKYGGIFEIRNLNANKCYGFLDNPTHLNYNTTISAIDPSSIRFTFTPYDDPIQGWGMEDEPSLSFIGVIVDETKDSEYSVGWNVCAGSKKLAQPKSTVYSDIEKFMVQAPVELEPFRCYSASGIINSSSIDLIKIGYGSGPDFLTETTYQVDMSSDRNHQTVPMWIKNNAKWWSEGKIGDSDFVYGIKYLIEQNIMKIPPTESSNSNSQPIPSWIKNNAMWWANEQISDDDFIKGIQYLISNGIMKISTIKNTSLCQGVKLCITGTIEKIVDGDTIYVNGEKIRLSLTNTPEKNDPGYSEATLFTSTLCPVGSTVTVDQDDKQPYDTLGRMVGKVFCGSKMLNEELLITNHAQILTQYCSKSEYESELWAKKYGC